MSSSNWRHSIRNWVESTTIQRIIVLFIGINAITLGLETSAEVMASHGPLITTLDKLLLSLFVGEIALKIIGRGWGFFRDPWNSFDFIVISIALLPASGPLAVLRTLRVLRVLRLISMLPQLRLVVESLLKAMPGIGAIGALMLVFFYVAAVMTTGLFGGAFPEWFGNVGGSMYTLFQIMTLESWSMGIVRPVMVEFPYAWLFFVPFILIATFTMLNLFIGIIVNTMQTLHEAEQAQEHQLIEAVVKGESSSLEAEVKALREDIHQLKQLLTQRAKS